MSGLEVGARAARTRTFTTAEVIAHVGLTGDAPPEPGAVPVGLLGGMISELLGTRLPGRGTNWMKQKYRFVDVARVGEPLTASVEITRLRPEKALVNLSSTCTASDGRLIFSGESLVLVKELEVLSPAG